MENEPGFEMGEAALSTEIADVLRSYGEEHGFDEETCQEIATMPFPDAFEAAYGYLVQSGLNADEILARFMQPPDED